MRGRLMRSYPYQKGMTAECSEAIRVLRNSGFAVAVIHPEVVGQPLSRGRVEKAMLEEGTRRSNELRHMDYGGVR
jgi:hypothetical protein